MFKPTTESAAVLRAEFAAWLLNRAALEYREAGYNYSKKHNNRADAFLEAAHELLDLGDQVLVMKMDSSPPAHPVESQAPLF